MITEIISGDITSRDNHADIIIGMNSKLLDVTGIGMPFVNKVQTAHPIDLGSVLSFKFDDRRHVHMVICHHLGKGGWSDAAMHVRFGLDYLWKTESKRRKFSIVQIGTGRVGKRDGADHVHIHTAMATSFRHFNKDGGNYTWWSAWGGHFAREADGCLPRVAPNAGRRAFGRLMCQSLPSLNWKSQAQDGFSFCNRTH